MARFCGMTGQELYDRMLNERFGINIESSADAQALDELLGGFCNFSIREYFDTFGILSIVASKTYRSHILYSRTDHYENSLKGFCRVILPSSMFVGQSIRIESIDDFL